MSYEYHKINTIRYMGNKRKLLDFIIPEIKNLTNVGDIVCDIMSGTSSIGYALMDRNIIISNDIQKYSYIISSFLLKNKDKSNFSLANDINVNFNKNYKNSFFNFFQTEYSDTYYSKEQCKEIDCLIYSINKIKNKNMFNFYMTVLFSAMCKTQNTTGHFAQFLPKNHYRLNKIRNMSVKRVFDEIAHYLSKSQIPTYKNYCYNLDYNFLFTKIKNKKIKCFYLDPPYTNDQYSRFYHILETAANRCQVDIDKTKAKYPKNRFMSGFCYKSMVVNEFEKVISFCFSMKSNLIISYTNNGLIQIDNIIQLCKKYYKEVIVKEIDYKFSKQGKGEKKAKEILIINKF